MADRPPPSATAIIIGTAILSLATGYMLGTATSLNLLPNPFGGAPAARPRSRSDTSHYDDEEESSEEEIDDGVIIDHAPNWANGEEADRRDGLRASALAAAKPATTKADKKKDEGQAAAAASGWDLTEECKLVLVVRTDLGMTKGKIAAQASHATLACYKTSVATGNAALRRWEREGQAKIALQIKSEDEMMVLMAQARSLGIVAEVIADAGRTQIASGSHTVLGVGPAPRSVVDAVTGGLKLL